jgi:integrase
MAGFPSRKRVDPVKWPGVYANTLKTKVHGKPDLAYYITYRDGTKKVWEKVGLKSEGMTPQVADDIRKERTLKARHGEPVLTAKELMRQRAKTNRPLDELAEAYFEQRGGSIQAARFDRYRYDKHVAPILGARPVGTLTPLDIQRVKKAMAALAPATVWSALELIRRLANYGRKTGLSPGLSFTIQMPKLDNQRVEYLTPEQAARLLATMDAWPAPEPCRMLKVAMFSGLRRGEIFKLQDGDLDFQNRLITLRAPKGGRTTSIPMNPIVEQILREQIADRRGQWERRQKKNPDDQRPESPYVFPGRSGGRRTDSTAVERIKAAAGLPAAFRPFHGLRHHFAVTLANSGEFSLDMIGELLTHKSSAMTRRYASFLPDSMKRAGARAAELLNEYAAAPADPAEVAK